MADGGKARNSFNTSLLWPRRMMASLQHDWETEVQINQIGTTILEVPEHDRGAKLWKPSEDLIDIVVVCN